MQLHRISDVLIWGAYVAIPFVLLFYARHRKNLPFRHLFWLFGLFIGACGASHLMGYITTFTPLYRLDAFIKIITALASWGTVVALWAISPRALSMRMPEELEREIEERQRVEIELMELNATLRERTEQLAAANAELEGFCYSISHDLRVPIRGIVGNSRILIEDASERLDDVDKASLERLGAAAHKMAQLVDDLLEFSRLGRSEVMRMPINLADIAADVAGELLQQCPAKFTIDPDLPSRADPQLVRVVFYNLLENAFKYSNPDGIEIQIGKKSTDGETVFFVKDNGIGFDMAYAPKIFLPFERLHRDSEYPGTGIGLANVRRILERHGGRIWAESAPGQGATFFFTLGQA